MTASGDRVQRVELVADDLILNLRKGQRGTVRGYGPDKTLVELDGPLHVVELPPVLLRPIVDRWH